MLPIPKIARCCRTTCQWTFLGKPVYNTLI